ncbi:hypothetical protein ACFR99_18835 [Haloarchaeobius amylolyticus]|uniref:Uncharacterized protein n=1 Tax=Haloarchaeobius amylolyticus TaxID=1198296 RepID=A0ABD6BLH3_9EURY
MAKRKHEASDALAATLFSIATGAETGIIEVSSQFLNGASLADQVTLYGNLSVSLAAIISFVMLGYIAFSNDFTRESLQQMDQNWTYMAGFGFLTAGAMAFIPEFQTAVQGEPVLAGGVFGLQVLLAYAVGYLG